MKKLENSKQVENSLEIQEQYHEQIKQLLDKQKKAQMLMDIYKSEGIQSLLEKISESSYENFKDYFMYAQSLKELIQYDDPDIYGELIAELAKGFAECQNNYQMWSHSLCHLFEHYGSKSNLLISSKYQKAWEILFSAIVKKYKFYQEDASNKRSIMGLINYNLINADPGKMEFAFYPEAFNDQKFKDDYAEMGYGISSFVKSNSFAEFIADGFNSGMEFPIGIKKKYALLKNLPNKLQNEAIKQEISQLSEIIAKYKDDGKVYIKASTLAFCDSSKLKKFLSLIHSFEEEIVLYNKCDFVHEILVKKGLNKYKYIESNDSEETTFSKIVVSDSHQAEQENAMEFIYAF